MNCMNCIYFYFSSLCFQKDKPSKPVDHHLKWGCYYWVAYREGSGARKLPLNKDELPF